MRQFFRAYGLEVAILALSALLLADAFYFTSTGHDVTGWRTFTYFIERNLGG